MNDGLISQGHRNSAVEVFASDGLTFAVNGMDGSVAVAGGTDGESRARAVRQLERSREAIDLLKPALAPELQSSGLTLMVAQRCNLRCVYCYGGDGEYTAPGVMDRNAAASAIDAYLKRDGAPARRINFFGGEPLLVKSLIRDLVGWALRLAVQYRRTMSFTMTTNATLADEEFARWLAPLPFTVMVSIDGDAEMHGTNRPDASGRSSWPAVVAGARLLLRYLGPERISARATLTTGFPEISTMVRTLSDIGFSRVAMAPVEPNGSAHSQGWTASDHARLRSTISAAILPELRSRTERLAWNPLQDTLDLLASGQRRDRPCGVGNSARAASSDGNLYPCHRYVGDARFIVGRADDATVEGDSAGAKLFEETRRSAVRECMSCFARAFCAGGCAHVALQRTDAGLPPHDHDECESIRWQVREAVRLFAQLRVPPAPGAAETLDSNYLLRPTATEHFRDVLLSAPRTVVPQARWNPRADAWMWEGFNGRLRPLKDWLDQAESPPKILDEAARHDWLTVSFPRFLVDAGVLEAPDQDESYAIGTAIALIAYMQALSNIRSMRESAWLAWADGYGRAVVHLRELPRGAEVSALLQSLSAEFVAARATEERLGMHATYDEWRAIASAKHRPLAFPAMVFALLRKSDSLSAEIGAFAFASGPMRQWLDDYTDVAEDKLRGKVNWCNREVAGHLGEIGAGSWPRVLAHESIASIVGGHIALDAKCIAGTTPWGPTAATAYRDWLSTAVIAVRDSYRAMAASRSHADDFPVVGPPAPLKRVSPKRRLLVV